MLVHINVENIALIDKASLELHENLNILSGETGAGKSMLIDSINFALGQRVPRTIIRRGKDYALVELLFESSNKKITQKLSEFGVSKEDNYILISRKLHSNGRTIYKINGQTVTRSMLQEISTMLLDVHGQHEHQSLLDSSKHIELLDKFGDHNLYEELDKYKELYNKYKELEQQLEKLPGDDKTRAQMIDILRFQIKEIKEANLKIGEEEDLEESMKILSNSEKIKENLQKTYDLLNLGDNHHSGLINILGEAIKNIISIADNSKELRDILEELQNVESTITEIIPSIRNLYEDTEYNPELLFETQQRLDLIYNLERKYGDNIEEILEHYKVLCSDLEDLENSDNKKEEIKKQLSDLEIKIKEIASKISSIRIEEADKISKKIEKELHELQIENAKFKIKVTPSNKIKQDGMDDVEFMISTNVGEPMQPLTEIVSGGEMSRIMLALKTILADKDEISTLIFDEIDTGISGRTAQKVAEKLAFIARRHQVICITHLPQIAAMSDHHYLISKDNDKNTTKTSVELLDDKNINLEISRLMAGALITDTTLENAKEIKKLANEFKNTLIK